MTISHSDMANLALLKTAINHAGGDSVVAHCCGVQLSTIRRWKREGIPVAKAERIAAILYLMQDTPIFTQETIASECAG
jgi:hypothetical protein